MDNEIDHESQDSCDSPKVKKKKTDEIDTDSADVTLDLNDKVIFTDGKKIPEMPWPAYSPFFQPISKSGNKLTLKCKICIIAKTLRADVSSSSNLKKHIKVSAYTEFLF